MARSSAVFDKVKAATAGGGLGFAVSAVIMWLLDKYVLIPIGMPGDVHSAVEIIVFALVGIAGSALGAYLGGYLQVERSGYRRSNPQGR